MKEETSWGSFIEDYKLQLLKILRVFRNEILEDDSEEDSTDVRQIIKSLTNLMHERICVDLMKEKGICAGWYLQKLKDLRLLFNIHAHQNQEKWNIIDDYVTGGFSLMKDIATYDCSLKDDIIRAKQKLSYLWEQVPQEDEFLYSPKELFFRDISFRNDYLVSYDVSMLSPTERDKFPTFLNHSNKREQKDVINGPGKISICYYNAEDYKGALNESVRFRGNIIPVNAEDTNCGNFRYLCHTKAKYSDVHFFWTLQYDDAQVHGTEIENLYYVLLSESIEVDSFPPIQGYSVDLFPVEKCVGFLEDKPSEAKMKYLEKISRDIQLVSFGGGFIATTDKEEIFQNLLEKIIDYKTKRIAFSGTTYPLMLIKVSDTLEDFSLENLCEDYGDLADDVSIKENKHGRFAFINFQKKVEAIQFYYEECNSDLFTVLPPKNFSLCPDEIENMDQYIYEHISSQFSFIKLDNGDTEIPISFTEYQNIVEYLENSEKHGITIPIQLKDILRFSIIKEMQVNHPNLKICWSTTGFETQTSSTKPNYTQRQASGTPTKKPYTPSTKSKTPSNRGSNARITKQTNKKQAPSGSPSKKPGIPTTRHSSTPQKTKPNQTNSPAPKSQKKPTGSSKNKLKVDIIHYLQENEGDVKINKVWKAVNGSTRFKGDRQSFFDEYDIFVIKGDNISLLESHTQTTAPVRKKTKKGHVTYTFWIFGEQKERQLLIEELNKLEEESSKILRVKLGTTSDKDFYQNLIDDNTVIIKREKNVLILYGFDSESKALVENDLQHYLQHNPSEDVFVDDTIIMDYLDAVNFKDEFIGDYTSDIKIINNTKQKKIIIQLENAESSGDIKDISERLRERISTILIDEYRIESHRDTLECYLDFLKNEYTFVAKLSQSSIKIACVDPELLETLREIFSQLKKQKKTLVLTKEEYKCLGRVNVKYISAKFGVLMTKDQRKGRKSAVILTTYSNLLSDSEQYLANFLNTRLEETKRITTDKNILNLIMKSHEMEITEFKKKVTLKGTQGGIEIRGKRNFVKDVADQYSKWIESIQRVSWPVDSDHRLREAALNKIKLKYETETNSTIVIKKNWKSKVLEISIYTFDDVQAISEKISSKIRDLPVFVLPFENDRDFSKVKSELHKDGELLKSDNMSFSWDKQTKTITIYGIEEEDIEQARSFIDGVTQNNKPGKHTILFTSLPISFRYVLRLREIKNKLRSLYRNPFSIKIDHNTKEVILRGPETGLNEAVLKFNQFVKTITKDIQSITINNPIYLSILEDNQILYKIERALDVRLQRDNQNSRAIRLQNGKSISVKFGDITEQLGCIVNSVNPEMKHAGGIARDIAEKAGAEYIAQCQSYIQNTGSMAIGFGGFFNPGKLPCEAILNVVTPLWCGGNNNEKEQMKSLIRGIFNACSNFESIYVPMLGTGVYCWRKDVFLDLFFYEAYQFLEEHPDIDLENIYLIDNDANNYNMMKNFLYHVRDTQGRTNRKISTIYEMKKERVWYWMRYEDDVDNQLREQGWMRYSDPVQKLLNDAYEQNIPTISTYGELREIRNNQKYTVDLINMEQFNTNTKKRREITFKEEEYPVISESQETDVSEPGVEYSLRIFFWKKDPLEVEQLFIQEITPMIACRTLNLKISCPPSFMATLMSKHLVHITEGESNQVEIQGSQLAVANCAIELNEYFIQANSVLYPEEWEDLDDSIHFKNYELDRSAPLWSELENMCKMTMTNINILRIEVVQNPFLYEDFYREKIRVEEKNGCDPNVHLLFHGTRNTDPAIIMQKGFDSRHSNQGMWGRGAYFAVNASYSNNYCYRNSKGEKQFFIASVILGESLRCAPDNTLVHPPVNPNMKGKYLNTDYDSITGHTNGSDVHIVYIPKKCYPSYFITYQ